MNDVSPSVLRSGQLDDGARRLKGQGIHNLGYRGWSGQLASGWTRWLVIALVVIRRSWQNTWLKRILFFAWLPTLWFGTGLFLWEQASNYPEWRAIVVPLTRGLPRTPVMEELIAALRIDDMAGQRHLAWGWLLKSFFRYPQAFLMVLMVGLIAPPLISQDIRSRAFLIYFSRPLTRTEYVIGKLAGLWAYLAMISAIPALVLYVMGILLSPSLDVIAATWDFPLRIAAASFVLMLPTSALALGLSSLTQESRIAGFAWFAVWILGWFTYSAVTSAQSFNSQSRFHDRNQIVEPVESAWTHLSLYHTLGRVQNWVFGFSDLSDVVWSIVILVVLTTGSLVILFRRISAPMRV
ncbi:ABC transporter permease [Schlesneria paludicola]|uniref:ABC transporter permease n=1 Tax=Schlesneria paludicola TaxID=360056 RepID=UPI00029ACDBD|nr:ABC transporter permease subunit [Schlesneria paludicola]